LTELEIIATITGIASVALQAKEKVIAWPFAIVSVSILAYIFFFEKLYSDLGLHVIYILLNIYGWVLWSQKKATEYVTPTKILSQNGMVYSAITTIIGCGLLGYLMSRYTDADLPFFDAFTTSGSLVAQYLLAKKYLQNWWLWIIVDLIAIPLYIYKGIYIIAGLFSVYLVICIWGYLNWKSEMAQNHLTIKT
jgi:nicotinamide mononucleotide transporter